MTAATTLPLAWIGNLGPTEMLLILAILVLIFGARKLPEIGRGIGEGIKNFRGALKDGSTETPEEGRAQSGKDTSA